MTNTANFNLQNFQSLIDNYEVVVQDITGELNLIQENQISIRTELQENVQLSSNLNRILADASSGDVVHQYTNNDLIKNLKLQLDCALREKEHTVGLWQNAAATVEHLETELQTYQDNTEGLVPKTKLIELKSSYEEKLKDLEATLTATKAKLEENINLRSKELEIKNKEIFGALQSQDNSFKIIKNLEDEVLNLQQRLNDASSEKRKLEKHVSIRNDIAENLRLQVKECKSKVEESLQLVDAAFKEKEAALIKENTAKDELEKLSKSFSDFIDETDGKVKSIKNNYDVKLEQLRHILNANEEQSKIKKQETENYIQKCLFLEEEIQRFKNSHNHINIEDGTSISKMLILEKNLEETFQKLLFSEKSNIKLKTEMENAKLNMNQTIQNYEKDVQCRETENTMLKADISKLRLELHSSNAKVLESTEILNGLNEKISTMEIRFKEQLNAAKDAFQQTCQERQKMEKVHNEIVRELQEQINLQTENNKKWRNETKIMTERLEKVITEQKTLNNKLKRENKCLNEKMENSNVKMLEYRKFLELVSQDVTKMTKNTFPKEITSKPL